VIYKIKTPDGRFIEVEGEEGQETKAIEAVRKYLANETVSSDFDAENFDYQTGIDAPGLRAQLDLAETVEEKELVLSNRVGSQGFTRDSSGNFALTPSGLKRLGIRGGSDKNIIIDESGFSKGDFADLAGIVGPIAGAVAALSPHGKALRLLKNVFKNDRISRTVASALGTAGGKGVEEAGELAVGLQRQSAGEVAEDLAYEAAIGGLSQGLFEAGGAALHGLLGRKAPIIDVDISRAIAQGADPAELVTLARSLGRTPTFKDVQEAQKNKVIETFTPAAVSQRALGRSIPGRVQAAAETVFGRKERDEKLIQYGNERLQNFLKKLNAQDLTLENFEAGITAGRLTTNQVDDYIKRLANDSDVANKELREVIRNSVKAIDEGAFSGSPDAVLTGRLIRDQLKEAYEQGVIKPFQKREKTIDNFLQQKGLDAVYGQIGIKLNNLERYVDNLVKKNPTIDKILADEISASPIKVIKDVIKDADGKGLSIEALNSVRGALLTIDRAKGSFSGKQGYYLKQTLDEIDKIFDDLASGNSFVADMIKVGPGRQQKAAIKNVSKAAQMIRGYNADYKAAVEAFNDPVIAKITHDAARGAFDVDTIFNQVVKNNRPELVNKVINALPSEAEKKLVLEGLRENIIKNAVRDSIDITTNEINPVFFAKHFGKLGSTADVIFKDIPNFKSTIDDFLKINTNFKAEKLARISSDLNSKEFTQALKRFTDAENELAIANSDRFLTRVSSASPDEVVSTLFRNGQAENISKMKGIVDPDTFKKVQQEGMRDLMRLTSGPGTRVDEVFDPNALERALNSKGDNVLNEMFGKETTQSLRALVRDLRVMTEPEKGGAGTLIAGAIAVNAFNLAMLPTVAKLGVIGMVMRQPSVVRKLAKSDAESVNVVYQAFKDAVRLYAPMQLTGDVIEGGRNVGSAAAEEINQLTQDSNLGAISQQLGTELQTTRRTLPKLPNLTTSAQLPQVQPVAGGIMSPSILGYNRANEDIARRISNIV
jgi:hypothetical protein